MNHVSVDTDRCRVGAVHDEAAVSNETTTTVSSNLMADPEPRHGAGGAPVARFAVASTSRVQDSASARWRDWDTLFLRCSVSRRTAQNVAQTLRRGNRVVRTERPHQRPSSQDEGLPDGAR